MENLSEKEHCAEGVFSWWVKLVSPSPHGVCSQSSELWPGWHQRTFPLRQYRQYPYAVAQRADEGCRKYAI